MTLQEWANAALTHQFGNYIDVDGYYQGQCWDLAAHYAREVVGCPSLPTVTGGAEGVYTRFAAPIPDYFTKVANNPSDANQLPPAGALIVYGPTSGNRYGHIEVVMGANASGVDVILQDGFNPTRGPFRDFRRWGTLPTLGWLVPKTQAKPQLQDFQRIVAKDGVYRRSSPSINETAIELFKGGDVLDFAGWLYGQPIDNNNVWYKGRYSDTYFWSGAFTDSSKNGLTDLNPVTPQPPKDPAQRIVGDGGLNVRSEASTMDQIIKVLAPGTVVTVQGFKTGANIDGNSTWFRIADGWVWSGGLTDASTSGISDVNPATPTPQPETEYPKPTTDVSVSAVYNKKHPLPEGYEPSDLVTLSNGQRLRSEAAKSLELMKRLTTSLNPASGYRSFATQTTLYNNYVAQDGKEAADRYSARPGYSEHQTGLTMDFAPIDDSFRNTQAYKFLTENGYKFGWINRYPDGKESITGFMTEPWHWRYVGVDVATDMFNKKVNTLEEYFNVEGGAYQAQAETPDTPETPEEPEDPVVVAPTPEPDQPPVMTEISTVIVNMLVTFVQSFLGAWAATGFNLDKVVIAGAVGAAASLVWNTILKPFMIKKGWLKQ